MFGLSKSIFRFSTIFAFTVASMVVMPVQAEDNYPSQTIKLNVGFPAGQMTDLLTRVVADHLGKKLNETVIVQNKPGQGGSMALAQLARSKADGYEIMLSPTAALVITPHLYSAVPYDSTKDFEFIGKVAEVPFVLVARSDMPFDDVAGFLENAKQNPNSITFTSPGNGTLPHLGMTLFQKTTNTSLIHIPYKGSPRAIMDMAAGRVDVGFDTQVVTRPFIEQGQIKLLAVTSEERVDTLPDTPTIREAGIDNFRLVAWFGLVAPKGTPESVINKLSHALKDISENPKYQDQVKSTGAMASWLSKDDFTDLFNAEYTQWKTIVKESGAQID